MANTNQLYARSSSGVPGDVLATTLSPSGLLSTVGPRVTLTESGGRYVNDRGTASAAQSPLVDLQMPMHVITAVTHETGNGNLTTEYLYKGLKAERGGRGLLGFREVRQQSPAPGNETLTIATEYLLLDPYDGVASRTSTYRGSLTATAPLLSSTVNIYCDRTSATNPDVATDTAPCATTAKVRRPYVRRTVEEGTDLAGYALPKVTTVSTYDDFGNPTNIVVTTEGTVGGLPNQTYTKSNANTFCPPDTAGCPNTIAGDNWILGRLTRSTVTNTVPNLLLAGLSASPGTAANATAIAGSVNAQPATLTASLAFGTVNIGANSTLAATLTNTGATAVSVTVPSAASVAGTDFSFVSTTCTASLAASATCTVSVGFTPTAGAARSGTLSVTTAGGTLTSSLSGTGQPVLATISQSLASTVAGGAYTITWGSTAAVSCTVENLRNGEPPGFYATGLSGSGVLTQAVVGTHVWRNTCTGSNGAQSQATFTHTVTAPAGVMFQSLGLNYGNVSIGANSTLSTTLTNTQATPLDITVPSAASVGGTDYSFVSTTCPATMAANASCTIGVRFTPTAAAYRSGNVTVNTAVGVIATGLSATGI